MTDKTKTALSAAGMLAAVILGLFVLSLLSGCSLLGNDKDRPFKINSDRYVSELYGDLNYMYAELKKVGAPVVMPMNREVDVYWKKGNYKQGGLWWVRDGNVLSGGSAFKKIMQLTLTPDGGYQPEFGRHEVSTYLFPSGISEDGHHFWLEKIGM